jgi:hypothetical protein
LVRPTQWRQNLTVNTTTRSAYLIPALCSTITSTGQNMVSRNTARHKSMQWWALMDDKYGPPTPKAMAWASAIEMSSHRRPCGKRHSSEEGRKPPHLTLLYCTSLEGARADLPAFYRRAETQQNRVHLAVLRRFHRDPLISLHVVSRSAQAQLPGMSSDGANAQCAIISR